MTRTNTDLAPLVPVDNLAERAVLGAIMDSAEVYSAALEANLTADSFFFEDHRRIFQTMLDLSEAGVPVDSITILDRLGGNDFLAALIADLVSGCVPVVSHTLAHVQILKRKARLRHLLNLSGWLDKSVGDPRADPDEIEREARIMLDEAKGVL